MKTLAIAIALAFASPSAFAVDCYRTARENLAHEAAELRFLSAELANVSPEVRDAALDLMRAVDESPWRTPETNIWRRLFARALHDPQNAAQVMIPIDDARRLFEDLVLESPRGLPADSALRARISQALTQPEIPYRTYAEIGVDATIEFQRLYPGHVSASMRTPEALEMRRQLLLNASLGTQRGGFRIPTTRTAAGSDLLGHRDFPPGYGPRLRQVAPAPVMVHSTEMSPLILGLHDDAHADYMDMSYIHLFSPGFNQGAPLVGRLTTAARQQRESNAIVAATADLSARNPFAGEAVEQWIVHEFHEAGGMVNWRAARQALDRDIPRQLYYIRRKLTNPEDLNFDAEVAAIRAWLTRLGH